MRLHHPAPQPQRELATVVQLPVSERVLERATDQGDPARSVAAGLPTEILADVVDQERVVTSKVDAGAQIVRGVQRPRGIRIEHGRVGTYHDRLDRKSVV